MTLSALIARLRESDLSLRELSIRAGLSQSACADIVRGRISPRIHVVDRLNAVLDELDEANDRPDLAPGFWPNYREPTELGRAIQMPLADPHWQNRVINAYRKTRAVRSPAHDV